MAVTIRRLEEFDDGENFDCGDEPLNNYLKRHAWTNQQKSSIGVTYVAVEESAPRSVLGYFTLATSSVPRDLLPKKHVRGLPPYDLPLILLARLAADHRFAGKGLGDALIARCSRLRSGLRTKLVAAALSQTHIAIGLAGMQSMGSFRSRAPQRMVPRRCC